MNKIKPFKLHFIYIIGVLLFHCSFSHAGNVKYRSKVEEMIATENWKSIEKYVAKKIDEADKVGYTALMWAVIYDKLEVVDYLLKEGANPDIGIPAPVNFKNHFKKYGIENVDYYNSPLYFAVEQDIRKNPNSSEIVERLLDAGANPNAFNHEYLSVLLFSIKHRQDYVAMLLQKGADINYTTPVVKKATQTIGKINIFSCIYYASKYNSWNPELFDLLVNEYNLNTKLFIKGLIMDYILLEYKYGRYNCRKSIVKHIELVNYILEKEYDTLTTEDFLFFVEISLYEAPHVGFIHGLADKNQVKWFVELFNHQGKLNSDELKQLFEDGKFISSVNHAERKEGESTKSVYATFLRELNMNVIAQNKEWLNDYGFVID